MSGWIKLHRQLLEWEWYSKPVVRSVFIHCLLRANHKEKQWQGKTIKQGEFISSLGKLSTETGHTVQEIRTAIKHLKSTGELTSAGSSQHTVFKVNNYEKWQGLTSEATSDQQTTNKRSTTNKNEKNIKNEKNSYTDEFEAIWKVYPKRKGGNSKSAANKACLARVKEGEDWQVMLSGAESYSIHCNREGKTGSPYVKQAQTFFGPERHYLDDWSVEVPTEVKEVVDLFNSEVVQPFEPVAAVIDEKRVQAVYQFRHQMNNDMHNAQRYFRYYFENADDWARGNNPSGKPRSFDYIISLETIQKARENNL